MKSESKLADAVTKGQHEYVLTTHIDKGHVHNHIIFCAVNFVDHHKYNSNKRSYYGIRNMSDKLCRENGLSVVVPGKGSKGKSYAEYQAEKTGTSWKGKLKTTVDALIPQVSSFEELLTRLQAAGYEIKPGKYVSCRAPGQERFTRLKTLGADYTEEAVRERIAGRRTKVAKAPREQRGVSLLIDIENSIKAAQSKGYEQWAKIHNLKQAAKTMNFLTEHKIEQYADLVSRIEEMAAESGQAADALKNAEKRLAEMAVLIKNVSTYQKTKPVYDAYRKARNREKYRAGQEQAIILHEAAVTIINALIDKILVSEREKLIDGTVRQEIKIYYKFIGFVGELHITPTKRWTALKPKNCTVCGIEYVPRSAISKYCPECRKRIRKVQGTETKRRSRERNRQACIELSAKNDRLKKNRGLSVYGDKDICGI